LTVTPEGKNGGLRFDRLCVLFRHFFWPPPPHHHHFSYAQEVCFGDESAAAAAKKPLLCRCHRGGWEEEEEKMDEEPTTTPPGILCALLTKKPRQFLGVLAGQRLSWWATSTAGAAIFVCFLVANTVQSWSSSLFTFSL
jgi:hypothetical protein